MSVKTKEQSKTRSYFFLNKVITFEHLEHLFAVFHPLMFFIQSTPLRSQVRSKIAPNILQLSRTTNHFKPASIFFFQTTAANSIHPNQLFVLSL